MKNLTLFGLASFALFSCGNNTRQTSTDLIHIAASADSNSARAGQAKGMPVISFEKTTHNFERITQGEQAEYNFKFTNTGNADLIISSASASCGCTVPEYSKEPVGPGESGYIKVKFNSENRLDQFNKTITVVANTNPTITELNIIGVVVPKEPETADNNAEHSSHSH